MKKKKFPKNTRTIDVSEVGMVDYPGILFEVWDDPNFPVLAAMITGSTAQKDQIDEGVTKRYFEAVSSFIIDCNIEGLDFSTPESTQESYGFPDLPMGFMMEFVASAIGQIITESEKVKKVLMALSDSPSSGSASGVKEEPSSPE